MKSFLPVAAGLLLVVACGRRPERAASEQIRGLLRVNRPYSALEVAEKFLQTHPDSDGIQRLRIAILMKTGQEEQAYASLQRLPDGDAILTDALRDPDPSLRGAVAAFIANYWIRGVSAKQLVHGLNDSEPEVRAYCVRALGRMHASEEIREIYRCLQDEHWLVRAEAATALGQVHDERVAGWLIGGVGDADPYVRFCSLQSLAEQPRGSTVAVLTEMLPLAKTPRKLHVALALAKLGETNVLPVLAVALKSSGVRYLSVEALRDLPVPMATNLMYELLSSTNRTVRKNASNVWDRVLRKSPLPAVDTKLSVEPF